MCVCVPVNLMQISMKSVDFISNEKSGEVFHAVCNDYYSSIEEYEVIRCQAFLAHFYNIFAQYGVKYLSVL